jgi:acetylglutamate kinase
MAVNPVVIKLGGEVVKAKDVLRTVCADLAALVKQGVGVVVVHGGGPQATELQTRLGLTPNIVGGRRITDDATLEVMKMTVAGAVNVDLCSALTAAGARPVGLNGSSGCAIKAHKRPPKPIAGAGPDPVDLGNVGDVDAIDRELVSLLLGGGRVPVLACLGADAEGRVYNINADVVANSVATLLEARSLVLVTDVPGVLRDVKDPGSRIRTMTAAEGKKAIEDGVVTKGMIPKLEESFGAIASGVRSVLIVGRLSPGDLTKAVNEPGSVGTVLLA